MTALEIIDRALTYELKLNYAFGTYNDVPEYPYFVGEYIESTPITEDRLMETAFILTGFTRGSWLELEEVKEKLRKYFDPVTGKMVAADGFAVIIFYENSTVVPTGEAELKRIEINLRIKEWRSV
ncbi:MAG: hypothetical protein HFE90_08950 [Firmicutes bacterium]|nr:hypothetical protein [Bacillota bacterium]